MSKTEPNSRRKKNLLRAKNSVYTLCNVVRRTAHSNAILYYNVHIVLYVVWHGILLWMYMCNVHIINLINTVNLPKRKDK